VPQISNDMTQNLFDVRPIPLFDLISMSINRELFKSCILLKVTLGLSMKTKFKALLYVYQLFENYKRK